MDKNLKLLDGNIVPVYQTSTGEQVVYGTELHSALEVKTKYTDWVARRFSECEAVENEDYQTCFSNLGSENHGGQNKKEHIIRLDIAKEMAMLERNEIGKKVRKHFIEVEKRYKQSIIDRSQLSPEMQMFYTIADGQARMELEQKRIAKEVEEVKQKQEAITETFTATTDTENFKAWVNKCIGKIAESPSYTNGTTRNIRYVNARSESYTRLKGKWNCNLDDRVARAKGRALENKPNISKAELNAINKLSVIADDKSLKPCYETVIKEMMICYCV